MVEELVARLLHLLLGVGEHLVPVPFDVGKAFFRDAIEFELRGFDEQPARVPLSVGFSGELRRARCSFVTSVRARSWSTGRSPRLPTRSLSLRTSCSSLALAFEIPARRALVGRDSSHRSSSRSGTRAHRAR